MTYRINSNIEICDKSNHFDFHRDLAKFKAFSPDHAVEWNPISSHLPVFDIKLPSIKELSLLPADLIKPKEIPKEVSKPNVPRILTWVNKDTCLKNFRWKVNSRQLAELNILLKKTYFPNTATRHELASKLGLEPRTIQIWFQNKRQAWKIKYGTDPPGQKRESSNSV